MALLKGYKPDEGVYRPKDRGAKKALIRQTYAAQGRKGDPEKGVKKLDGWNMRDHRVNCEMLGLPFYESFETYAEAELDIFIADFERSKMVIFKD